MSRWAVAFAVGYGLLRLYWALGGRWGYTACDRAGPPRADGCGAAVLGFWPGWGAVVACAALVAAVALARHARVARWGAWAASAVLVVLSFPAHLAFELPAAAFGRPVDWRDLGHRLALLAGGVLVGAAAARATPRRVRPAGGPRVVPAWGRWWAYAACVLPVLGFALPHLLWFLGVPLGVSAQRLRAIAAGLDAGTATALVAAPVAGGLLALGLAHGWGQVVPPWVPWLGGRRVPRALALVPAGVVALALSAYGVLGLWLLVREPLPQLAANWALAATEVVFLGWGVALGGAALAYHRATTSRLPEPGTDQN